MQLHLKSPPPDLKQYNEDLFTSNPINYNLYVRNLKNDG